jgi:hypothetical protein
MRKGRFHFNWLIRRLSREGDELLVERCQLDDGGSMIVVTDTAVVSDGVYRQAGFGPFDGELTNESEVIDQLKSSLRQRRG